jgi:ParB-like chromosome segregation protein Spo0J
VTDQKQALEGSPPPVFQGFEATPIAALRLSEIKIGDEYQGLIRPLSTAELEHLKHSISKEGVRVPIEVNEKNEVLDGHHRVQISIEQGLEYIPARIHSFNGDLDAERQFIYDVNVPRRHLNDFEKLELRYKLDQDPDQYSFMVPKSKRRTKQQQYQNKDRTTTRN